MSDSLSQLISSAGGGDEAALNAVLARYRPYLRIIAERAVRPIFRNRFDGSDIVQQTCYDACRGITAFRGASEPEFNAWITRILNNNVSNLVRDHTADIRDVRRERVINVLDSETSLPWWDLAQPGASPESRIIKGEAALLLADALSKLTDRQRVAMQLRFFEGCTLSEIAEYMESKPASVAGLIERGLQALQEHLPDGIL